MSDCWCKHKRFVLVPKVEEYCSDGASTKGMSDLSRLSNQQLSHCPQFFFSLHYLNLKKTAVMGQAMDGYLNAVLANSCEESQCLRWKNVAIMTQAGKRFMGIICAIRRELTLEARRMLQ